MEGHNKALPQRCKQQIYNMNKKEKFLSSNITIEELRTELMQKFPFVTKLEATDNNGLLFVDEIPFKRSIVNLFFQDDLTPAVARIQRAGTREIYDSAWADISSNLEFETVLPALQFLVYRVRD